MSLNALVVKPTLKIAIVSNSAWNIHNFRLSLVKKLQAEGFEVVAIAPHDKYALELAKVKGLAFVPVQNLNRKSLSLIGNLRLLFELSRIFAQQKPDLAILYTIKPNIFGSFAAWLQNTKSISSLEGQGYLGKYLFFRRGLSFLYKKAFSAAQKVIFLNEPDRREFLEKGLVAPEKAVLIHGPGVNTEHFHATAKKKHAAMVFLFCGRLLEEKGVREFVVAAKTCKTRGLKADFQILGGPDEENPTSIKPREIEGWIHEGHITYFGHQDDVRHFLSKADVVVLPSTYHEGVPRSLLEAMSMNKVIITSDSPGCRDTVADGKNGFVIPAKDAAALVGAIEKCCRLSHDDFFEMGKYARELVLNEFDDRIVLEKYLELIKGLTARKENSSSNSRSN